MSTHDWECRGSHGAEHWFCKRCGNSNSQTGKPPPNTPCIKRKDPQLPLPPYTPPKPGPTDEELDALLNQLASAHGTSYPRRIARDWFADVTARIEREKGK